MIPAGADLEMRASEALRAYRACLAEVEAAETARESAYAAMRLVSRRLREAAGALLRQEKTHEEIEALTRESAVALARAKTTTLIYNAAFRRLDVAYGAYAELDRQLGHVPKL